MSYLSITFQLLNKEEVRGEANRGGEAQAYGCKRGRLWVRFPFEKIKYLIF